MKLILKEDIGNLGKMGDIVNVANGYGRNFLIPGKKAVEATTQNIKQIENEKRVAAEKLQHGLQEMEELARILSEKSVTITRQVGEGEKMFGAVTSADIADALEKEGITVDKRQINMEKPFKELGLFQVPIKLNPDITAEIKVWVVKE